MLQSHKPLIGITLDSQEEGSFSARPHFALRKRYFEAISKAGGLGIGIPHITEDIEEYLDQVSALVVPGGGFATPDEWYIDPNEPKPYESSPRLAFDVAIIEAALKRDMPLLCICAGMQILGGILGCKLTPNVNKYLNSSIDHLNEKPAEEYGHAVEVEPNTLLHKIVQCNKFDVNTAHQEAIVEAPDNVVINCKAPDGCIEGIELPNHKFALGVQWHPEFFTTQGEKSFEIIQAFVKCAKDQHQNS